MVKNSPADLKTAQLTNAELELMAIIWRLGTATVRDVLDQLPRHRKLAYTSVSTILRILEKKGVLTSEKVGRGHVYQPLLQKQEYEVQSLDHLISRVFTGTPLALVERLIDTQDLSESDLASIQELINQRLKP